MKNVYSLPTAQPSRLAKHSTGSFHVVENKAHKKGLYQMTNQHIYITSDEEIKEGDWFYNTFNDNQAKIQKRKGYWKTCFNQHKIILTTDQDLIKDGVQTIDDEFLEWFVKNPNFEEIKVNPYCEKLTCKNDACNICCQELKYEIIIPK